MARQPIRSAVTRAAEQGPFHADQLAGRIPELDSDTVRLVYPADGRGYFGLRDGYAYLEAGASGTVTVEAWEIVGDDDIITAPLRPTGTSDAETVFPRYPKVDETSRLDSILYRQNSDTGADTVILSLLANFPPRTGGAPTQTLLWEQVFVFDAGDTTRVQIPAPWVFPPGCYPTLTAGGLDDGPALQFDWFLSATYAAEGYPLSPPLGPPAQLTVSSTASSTPTTPGQRLAAPIPVSR